MKLKNIVHVVFATAPIWMAVSTIIGINYFLNKHQQYLNSRLAEISQKTVAEVELEQQSKTGITSCRKPLKIRLACLHQFGYEGEYAPNTDLVTIDSCIIQNDNETRRVLSHELGHFYADKLNETAGLGNWPNFENKTFVQQQAIHLVSEGIGEYFERATHPKADDFKDSNWPAQISDFSILRIRYNGGFHLVKPIIDLHKKAGIEYLIANPPQEKDLLNLPAYQRKALEFLEARK